VGDSLPSRKKHIVTQINSAVSLAIGYFYG